MTTRKSKAARELVPANPLTPSRPDDIFQRLCAWDQAENPSREELFVWLRGVCETLATAMENVIRNADGIRSLSEVDRLKATSVYENSHDFICRSKVAVKLVDRVGDGTVRDAFVEGVRIGLLHEKIMSLIDGRYTEKWLKDEARQRAAKTVNQDHLELHSEYQPAVDRLMGEGLSYTAACEKVASSKGVSSRTVRDHTRNHAPRNRGRWPR